MPSQYCFATGRYMTSFCARLCHKIIIAFQSASTCARIN